MRQDLQMIRPDHVAITGDLTNLALPHEFEQARQWLCSLGAPADVTVVPGNHDCYVSTAWPQSLACWQEYMVSDAAATPSRQNNNEAGDEFFPSLRLRGSVALIGVSTACPSRPFLATGSVGGRQLARLKDILQDTGKAGLFRIVLIHHPPLQHLVGWRKRLTDGAALLGVLCQGGAELLLHGHVHRTVATSIETDVGELPVVGVSSASAVSNKPRRQAEYHVIYLRQLPAGWQVKVSSRSYRPDTGRFSSAGERCFHICRL